MIKFHDHAEKEVSKIFFLLLLLLALAPVTPIMAEEPLSEVITAFQKYSVTKCEQQAYYDGQADRYVLAYDGIKPDQWLVCDTVIRRIPDGRLAYFFLAGGTTEPSPKNYVAVMFSSDDGVTWTKPEEVKVGFPRSGKTIGQCPTEFLTVEDGKKILLFFSTHSNTWNTDWFAWMIRSADNCKTWSKPEPLPGRLGKASFVRPVIRTSEGLLIVPCQHYLDPSHVANSRNSVMISKDDGRTWKESGDIRCPLPADKHLWAEPTLVELPNRHLVMLIRPEWGGGTTLYRADSFDGGRTWPEVAQKTDIPNPSSKATLLSLGGNKVALIHNPNPRHRSPLSLWISCDGMKTWPYKRILVGESCDGPKGCLNYPEGFVSPDKNWIYMAFDNNRHQAIFMKVKLPSMRFLDQLEQTASEIADAEQKIKAKKPSEDKALDSGKKKESKRSVLLGAFDRQRKELADQIAHKGFSPRRLEVMKEFILPALVRSEELVKKTAENGQIPSVPLSAMLTPHRSPDVIYEHYLDSNRLYFNVIYLDSSFDIAKLELQLDQGVKMEFPVRSAAKDPQSSETLKNQEKEKSPSEKTKENKTKDPVRLQGVYVLADQASSYIPAGLPDTTDHLYHVPAGFPFDIKKIQKMNPKFTIIFQNGSRSPSIPVWCQQDAGPQRR